MDIKPKIKVKFSPYGTTNHETPHTYANYLYKILEKNFTVEISNDPDFYFYHESSYDFLKYDCVKIFYTGENISPNFNFCDYAISFDWLEFEDRHFRLPLFIVAQFYRPQEIKNTSDLNFSNQLNLNHHELKKKTNFCSFVYSNYRGASERHDIFRLLSEYKKVNAGGKFLNNIGYKVEDKFTFEKGHKFSIAFENSSRSGYVTEKIVNSFLAETIPIYWGDPNIGRYFNTRRFINCHDYPDFKSVVEQVKKIDSDDALYLKMVNEPVLAYDFNVSETLEKFELFLFNICRQSREKAKRATLNSNRKKDLERREAVSLNYDFVLTALIRLICLIYKPFRNIKFIDTIKQRIVSKY